MIKIRNVVKKVLDYLIFIVLLEGGSNPYRIATTDLNQRVCQPTTS